MADPGVCGELLFRADAGALRVGQLPLRLLHAVVQIGQAVLVLHAIGEEEEDVAEQQHAHHDQRDFPFAPDHDTGLEIDGR